MKVNNWKCIRRLSFKSLWASRKRNLIAVCAIALTALLFTSLFTVIFSINTSYQSYQFRQLGGYNHGTFKDVTDEQADAIASHSSVKETGIRKVIGFCSDGVFSKLPAEVSYMDKNCAKWSYAEPTVGRYPESGLEIAMDTGALKLLGITPRLGAKIPVTYEVGDKNQISFQETDTFTLVGYWEYDNLLPVHYLNISEDYADQIEAKGVESGMDPFRKDLNVMMSSSINIRGQMEQVDRDLGYTWDSFTAENSVRIGVNWGYTTSHIDTNIDPAMITAMAAFLILVIFTGYLIIYNIFQISVSGDIRFYGLLKTIGTTPKQLRRIIRQQALLLCAAGIPVGLLLGYGVGATLTPVVMQSTIYGGAASTVSTSPLIFAGSALFALVTVLLSCSRPGRLAAKVSPVEAAKYTEGTPLKKKSRPVRGAKIHQMAFANLGRNKLKTILVVLSLALSVTLFNELIAFVRGFDMEQYVSAKTCADFVVSSPHYFRFDLPEDEYISQEAIKEINSRTDIRLSGSGYTISGTQIYMGMKEDILRANLSAFNDEDTVDHRLDGLEHRGDLVMSDALIEGLDESLFEKLTTIDGDLAPLSDPNSHAIAVCAETDDYGNMKNPAEFPKVGDTLTAVYITDAYYIDSRTGELPDENTTEEFLEWHIEKSHEVDYTVCALVKIPYQMSYRYDLMGHTALLSSDALKRDSGQPVIPLFYLFDTPDEAAEAEAESYLAEKTADDLSPLMYESKATVRAEFKAFQNMFLILGGLLCAIIGIVGILNYFNAIMTGILSRRREFAVLQSVGMTNRQLKSMLIYEGLFYAFGSVSAALILSLILGPLFGNMLGNIFWFCNYQFTIAPVLFTIPIFALLGWLIPSVLYRQTARQSVVERLRESD